MKTRKNEVGLQPDLDAKTPVRANVLRSFTRAILPDQVAHIKSPLLLTRREGEYGKLLPFDEGNVGA